MFPGFLWEFVHVPEQLCVCFTPMEVRFYLDFVTVGMMNPTSPIQALIWVINLNICGIFKKEPIILI